MSRPAAQAQVRAPPPQGAEPRAKTALFARGALGRQDARIQRFKLAPDALFRRRLRVEEHEVVTMDDLIAPAEAEDALDVR
jgi:hypothetical protein